MKNFTFLLVALFLQSAIAQTARVQIIHNSADAAAEEVDIYLDGSLTLDDFAFRTATPFIDFPAEVEVEIGVAPGDSNDVSDAIAVFPVTLAEDETYIVIANGIVSGSGYSPSPAFNLDVFPMGQEEAANMDNADVLVYHGSTDAPTVDVVETAVGAGTIVDDISYSEFQGYLELPVADYTIEVRDETGETAVAAYDAPISTLGLDSQALTVLASGFLDPSMNSDGPAFGLFVALSVGGELIPLPEAPLSTNDFALENVVLYPNPAVDQIKIQGLDQGAYSFEIHNIEGKLVYSSEMMDSNPSFEIDVTNLTTGLYTLTVYSDNKNLGTKRFLKK